MSRARRVIKKEFIRGTTRRMIFCWDLFFHIETFLYLNKFTSLKMMFKLNFLVDYTLNALHNMRKKVIVSCQTFISNFFFVFDLYFVRQGILVSFFYTASFTDERACYQLYGRAHTHTRHSSFVSMSARHK